MDFISTAFFFILASKQIPHFFFSLIHYHQCSECKVNRQLESHTLIHSFSFFLSWMGKKNVLASERVHRTCLLKGNLIWAWSIPHTGLSFSHSFSSHGIYNFNNFKFNENKSAYILWLREHGESERELKKDPKWKINCAFGEQTPHCWMNFYRMNNNCRDF